MKARLLLPCSALLLSCLPANAQLLAGEVPDGMNAMDVNLSIALTVPFTADSSSIEFDCDDFHDAKAVLYRGAPEVDGPNVAVLRFVDDDIEVCANMLTGFLQRPKYHTFGEALDCAGGFDWHAMDQIVLGDFGGFTATGPVTVTNQYIAYRRGPQIGWILLSFNVQGGLNPVSMQVHQLLPLCPGAMSVGEGRSASGITLFPNPSNGGPIRVESADAIRSIDVLDATGRSIAQYNGAIRSVPSPGIAGTYVVRATHADGRVSVMQLVSF